MSKTILILVPTPFELDKLRPRLNLLDHESVEVAVCGFGPVAAAARAAVLIEQHKPKQVLIIGIAGALDDSVSVGNAVVFSDAFIDGIGAGSGSSFESAEAMGWNFWGAIGSQLSLANCEKPAGLLTVCAASGSKEEADSRRQRFAGVVAEDMETFAVAFAATVAKVPVTAIRGISNTAGDRDKTNWEVDDALAASALLTNAWVEEILN